MNRQFERENLCDSQKMKLIFESRRPRKMTISEVPGRPNRMRLGLYNKLDANKLDANKLDREPAANREAER